MITIVLGHLNDLNNHQQLKQQRQLSILLDTLRKKIRIETSLTIDWVNSNLLNMVTRPPRQAPTSEDGE